ncbi:hypothetical protein D910_00586, partial [Dendroctonus ponderosae]
VANANQKRARTRITDEQLKILRAHFDINNSPSEDQIHEMANRSGLPPKVIKHWFRNTLFKERQRNKDSPYNFNNPPSTTLNLEEYEKTGEAKVVQLNSSSSSGADEANKSKESPVAPTMAQVAEVKTEIKEEPLEEPKFEMQKPSEVMEERMQNYFGLPTNFQPPQSPATSVASTESLNVSSQPATPNNITLTSIIASQLSDTLTSSTSTLNLAPHGLGSSNMLPPPKVNQQTFSNPGLQGMLPLTSSRCLSPSRDYSNSGSQGSGGSTGKRANRTRFTDYQIKVLQEFFENNAYPKDDDLEYLSKLLQLSPRVIVVWFQNARQKARKVYENQPAVETSPGIDESGANRFQRTPGLNYQCKKCMLVFQRYYELIRHQKTHCFKEEDAKRSAQAQAAAAQMAASFSSEDSNSSTAVEQNQAAQGQPQNLMSNQSPGPSSPLNSSQGNFASSSPTPSEPKEGSFQCGTCNQVFPRFEQFKEHELVHFMNPNLFPIYAPDSPFGILQQQAHLQQQMNASMGEAKQAPPNFPNPLIDMLNNVTGQRRKFDEIADGESDTSDQPKDKRLRTTILPDQLEYLYKKYQCESNPSRKMLENIARDVGLKKRVVQVWFQNTRARERKGQFRAHSQVINKRCPICHALFKVKSAFESHLTSKHPEHCARGEINIDALPDEEISLESAPSLSGGSDTKFQPQQPPAHPNLAPAGHSARNKPSATNFGPSFFEDKMNRFFNEIQMHTAGTNGEKTEMKSEKAESREAPLDLSKPVDLSRPMKVSMEQGGLCDPGPLTDLSERSLCDERSDSMSETTEYIDDESNPTSPASSTQSLSQRQMSSCGGSQGGNKRYRTQMSSVQVKIMKTLFVDYKTPTMAECEGLGREIGLPKRVVQVWFQNARAKEKKGKLALHKVLGQPDGDNPTVPDDCRFCSFKYSHKYSIQDHIFTKTHIANVRMYYEAQAAQAGKDSQDGNEFQVPQLPSCSGSSNTDPNNPQGAGQQNNNTHHADYLQQAAKQQEDSAAESLFQPFYASNFGVQNQYVHHAMFGANGKFVVVVLSAIAVSLVYWLSAQVDGQILPTNQIRNLSWNGAFHTEIPLVLSKTSKQSSCLHYVDTD